jgi:hypothetical protein
MLSFSSGNIDHIPEKVLNYTMLYLLNFLNMMFVPKTFEKFDQTGASLQFN